MPISIVWMDEEKTLIFVEIMGKLSGQDFLDAVPLFLAMLQTASHPVDVICDQRRNLYFSPGYLETARKVHHIRYPNLRLVVFVGKNLAWELFITFARRFKRIPYQFEAAASIDEAHQMIKSFRVAQAVAPPTSSANWN